MSSSTRPISPTRFAQALEELPVGSLHAKAAEIRNSIAHLESSNEQLEPFASEGDKDCSEAIEENVAVIGRMKDRVTLLRAEVEKRGLRWGDAEVEDGQEEVNGTTIVDETHESSSASNIANNTSNGRTPGGTVSDEEMRRRLEEMMQLDEDEDDGVHL